MSTSELENIPETQEISNLKKDFVIRKEENILDVFFNGKEWQEIQCQRMDLLRAFFKNLRTTPSNLPHQKQEMTDELKKAIADLIHNAVIIKIAHTAFDDVEKLIKKAKGNFRISEEEIVDRISLLTCELMDFVDLGRFKINPPSKPLPSQS